MNPPKSRYHDLLINLLLMLGSLLFLALLLELVVFRFILVASDNPRNAFIDDLIRYEPYQTGIYRVKDEIEATFNINAQGWNSGYDTYTIEKNGRTRIAIIGDSFVEALMVNHDESLAEDLENQLGPDKYEVYRFAISGAPLSQYYYMFREEVVDYAPDVVVFNLVHNDFDESYTFHDGRYTSSFLKLDLSGDEIQEIPPTPYESKWYEILRETSTFRYLCKRQQVDPRILLSWFSSNDDQNTYQANIDISDLETEMDQNRRAIEYLFQAIQELAESKEIEVVIVMDGDRDSIYHGLSQEALYENGALSLNELVREVALAHDLAFIDLQPLFAEDYAQYGLAFNSNADHHWNAYAHALVADALAQYLTGNL